MRYDVVNKLGLLSALAIAVHRKEMLGYFAPLIGIAALRCCRSVPVMAFVAGACRGDLTGATDAMCDHLAACADVWGLAHVTLPILRNAAYPTRSNSGS